MRRTRRRSGTTVHSRGKLFAVLGAAFLIVASCGSNDDENADTAAETENPASDTAVDAEETATAPSCDTPGMCEPSDELIEAAQAEGEVVVYTSSGTSVLEPLAAAFEERYGVTLSYTIMTAAEVQARAEAELAAGNVLVDYVDKANAATFEQWYEDGFVETYSLDEVPNLGVLEEDQYGPGEDAEPGDDPYGWYPTGGSVFVLTWNPEVAPHAPTSFCELTDPEWEGLVGGNFQPGTTNFMHHKAVKDLCGEDYFVDLAENGLKTYPATTPGTEALVAGELAVFLNGIPAYIDQFNEQGAQLEYTTEELATIPVIHGGAVKGGSNPNAAQLYVNFLLSQETQSLLFGGELGYSVLSDELVPDAVTIEGETFISTREGSAAVEDEILEDIGHN